MADSGALPEEQAPAWLGAGGGQSEGRPATPSPLPWPLCWPGRDQSSPCPRARAAWSPLVTETSDHSHVGEPWTLVHRISHPGGDPGSNPLLTCRGPTGWRQVERGAGAQRGAPASRGPEPRPRLALTGLLLALPQECAPTLAHIPFLFPPGAETSSDSAEEPGGSHGVAGA